MSTELTKADEIYNTIVAMSGPSDEPIKSATPSVARLNVNQTPIEADVEFNGKMLKDEVIPKGAYKLTVGDNTVYSKTASIRIFETRYQWQRWNGDTGEMEKSVLAKSLNGDLQDSIGGFNLGRPSGYIEDWNALPEATKTLIRSVKRVKVFFGLVTLDSPVDESGNPVSGSYTDIPFVFDVKNRDSLKSLDAALAQGKPSHTTQLKIDLSPAVGTIPTGATFGYVSAKLGGRVNLIESDPQTLGNFQEFITYINGTILDKHEERRGDGMTDTDKEIVASIVEVDE